MTFASEGADVILVARNHDMLETVAAEITASGRRALAISCDVSSAEKGSGTIGNSGNGGILGFR